MTSASPHTPTERNVPIKFPASSIPGLARVRTLTRRAFTKQWPTRHLALCPPAHGAVAPMEMLQSPDLFEDTARSALVVFLPNDFEPHLEHLVLQPPQLRVHELVGLRACEVYLSVSALAASGKLPKTFWIRAPDLLANHLNKSLGGRNLRVPVLLVSGLQAAVCHWTFDSVFMEQIQVAIRNCVSWQSQASVTQKERALEVAEKYGERPWLFMRYDVTNLTRRYAVNWAPVCTLRDEGAVEYQLG